MMKRQKSGGIMFETIVRKWVPKQDLPKLSKVVFESEPSIDFLGIIVTLYGTEIDRHSEFFMLVKADISEGDTSETVNQVWVTYVLIIFSLGIYK